MKKTLISLSLIIILVLSLASVAAANKVEICHRPPDNPSNVRLIKISINALADHLAQGAHLSFGGYCYVVVPDDQSASLSEQYCQDQFGGHLASIHSLAEDNFISQLVDPDAVGYVTARIGGYAPSGFCSGPYATYAWTDGTPWDYQNWRLTTGEPSCSGGHNPGSIQFWPNTNGWLSGWNDTPAGAHLSHFVCKYQP
ncbi:MAG: hypothetical protein ABFS17_10260 [Chloroflexota bacterium]